MLWNKRKLPLKEAVAVGATLSFLLALGTKSKDNFFPFHDGWLGADAAYSVPLKDGYSVWLLGDTFVGEHRTPATMIHNSVAIRKCHNGCSFTYWWSGMHSGRPDSFFKTSDSNYYWPLDGFSYGGKLYCFLEQMHSTGAGGAFGFDYSSVRLAVIANPMEPPDHWRISFRTVSSGNQVIPGLAISLDHSLDGQYISAFTLFRPPGREPFVGLLRHSVLGLESDVAGSEWEYLTGTGRWQEWKPSQLPSDVSKLIDGNITEMTVKFHPQQNRWLAIFSTPGLLEKTASYSVASRLTGPWTRPQPFFEYPEMKKVDARYTPNVFCYAPKEHPELESDVSKMALSFACNSTKESDIFRDLRLYRLQLVVQPYP